MLILCIINLLRLKPDSLAHIISVAPARGGPDLRKYNQEEPSAEWDLNLGVVFSKLAKSKGSTCGLYYKSHFDGILKCLRRNFYATISGVHLVS